MSFDCWTKIEDFSEISDRYNALVRFLEFYEIVMEFIYREKEWI